MIKGGFIWPREMNEEIEDIHIADRPEEILKEELAKDINRSLRDMKAFYILSLINKHCEIYNYLNMKFSLMDNNDLAYKNILDTYYEKVKDTMFFKGEHYALFFFYKNISMYLYRENVKKPIYLKFKENEKELSVDLSFLSDFIEKDEEFVEGDLYDIKNKLLDSFFNMSLTVSNFRDEMECERRREERLNGIIKKALEEE